MGDMDIETRLFGADAGQVAAVRDWVGKLLDGRPHRDDAVLAASELATNAILHTRSGNGGTFEVTIVVSDAMTRLYVIDQGSAAPVPHVAPQRQAAGSEAGRGLVIVDAVACRWGYEPGHDSGMTWCELAAAG